jgi:hypothetical protein
MASPAVASRSFEVTTASCCTRLGKNEKVASTGRRKLHVAVCAVRPETKREQESDLRVPAS